MRLTKQEASEYGLRAQKRRKDRTLVMVEGEYVNVETIAARIDRTYETARTRLRREQAKAGPVTWQGLNEK